MNQVVHWRHRPIPQYERVPACGMAGTQTTLDPRQVSCELCRPLVIAEAAAARRREEPRRANGT